MRPDGGPEPIDPAYRFPVRDGRRPRAARCHGSELAVLIVTAYFFTPSMLMKSWISLLSPPSMASMP